jgi:uncharacterized protein
MNSDKNIIGRDKEIKKLDKVLQSKKSEFVAFYGRRRVGKTFLIREYFDYKFHFYLTGLAKANTKMQLYNFDASLLKHAKLQYDTASENWLVAFQRLINYIESVDNKERKIIFIDELPWLDTHGSNFITGLEHFWNHFASARKDILFIVCGSASSWMVNELINNSGGLHNRVTNKIKMEPFNLHETEQFLIAKNCVLNKYQIVQLYMVLGGIPFYLDAVQADKSAMQNIQELFFDDNAILKNEYFNLYRALFKKYKIYEDVVEILSTNKNGIPRNELVQKSNINSGGTLTKVLLDLEESGFIDAYIAYDAKEKNTIYRLTDYYTNFYFKFIASKLYQGANAWINLLDNPSYRAWQGFAFEQICLDHTKQIKIKLGIEGIQSKNVSWKGSDEKNSAQIDLLIDRRDQVINLCECKFSIDQFTIDKAYAENLRKKISIFKTATATKSSVFLTMITTYGVTINAHSNQLMQNEIVMDDLFVAE